MSTPVILDFSKAQPLEAAVSTQPSKTPGPFRASGPSGGGIPIRPEATPAASQGVTLDFSKAQPIAGPGEQIGYSGLKDIVPMEGEDFADTMKRAIAYGKTLTQADIDKQTKADAKVAPAVLAAAPAIGAAGAAALTGAGETAGAVSGAFARQAVTKTVGTGIVDAAGNEFMRDVTTYGPSLVQKFGTQAIPWIIQHGWKVAGAASAAPTAAAAIKYLLSLARD